MSTVLQTSSSDDSKNEALSSESRCVDTWTCGGDTRPQLRTTEDWKDSEELCQTPPCENCIGVDVCVSEPKTVEKDICTQELHSAPIDKVLQALENSRDTYAQELLRLKAITGALSANEACNSDKDFATRDAGVQTFSPYGDRTVPSTACAALMDKLSQEKDNLRKELEEQRNSYNNIQRQLEQEREEKLEAQNCINMLNETLTAALNGEKFLVEEHRHLLADHRSLVAKFASISKAKLTSLKYRLAELESGRGDVQPKDDLLELHRRLWIHGLSTGMQFGLFCHCLFVFLTRVLNADFNHGPT